MLVENLSVPADPRVWAEATTLCAHGFEVNVICPKGIRHDRESYACINWVRIYRYSLPAATRGPLAFILEYALALICTFWLSLKILFRHGFDIIHTANPPDIFFLIAVFYQLLGKKFIYDLSPELFRVKFAGRLRLLHRLLLFFEYCS